MTQPQHQLTAVVFDWAGTMIDFGSCAPMGAFVKLFEKFNIQLSIEQARGPMGMAKLDHIKALLAIPEINQQWLEQYGTKPTDADAEHLYEVFTPMNAEVVGDFADFIPGAIELINTLRHKKVKIGSTTGYNRPIMERLLPIAAKAGYSPDNLVCAGDLAAGRPSPLMMYQTFADLGVWPPYTVVKVDDTGVGIEEGLNAGTWTVAVAISGNEVGLSLEEWQVLDSIEQDKLRQQATVKMQATGAHYVIDTIADLLPVLTDIENRLKLGERP